MACLELGLGAVPPMMAFLLDLAALCVLDHSCVSLVSVSNIVLCLTAFALSDMAALHLIHDT